jgi:response regulator RpfG family c-di-GMP phosphodiesterase
MKEQPKILIVDDRIDNLIALEKLLADLDVDFVRATSGNEALKKILKTEFAIALVDVQMPGMDGFETVEFIRQQKNTMLLPIIFLSAIYKEDYHQIKGIKAGAVDFIIKPITPEILIGKVRAFLDLYNHKLLLQEAHDELEQRVEERTNELFKANKELEQHRKDLEKTVRKRTAELQKMVNLMAGREMRMAELKKVIRKLREQLESSGLTPVVNDPLKEVSEM